MAITTVTTSDTPNTGRDKFNQNFAALNHAEVMVALSDETSDLVAGAAALVMHMPFAMIVTEVMLGVNVAPTGSPIIVDVNLNGASAVSTERPAILAGDETNLTSSTPGVVSLQNFAKGARVQFDIDQVGSTTPGKGLKATLIGRRA